MFFLFELLRFFVSLFTALHITFDFCPSCAGFCHFPDKSGLAVPQLLSYKMPNLSVFISDKPDFYPKHPPSKMTISPGSTLFL